jgi:peptidoglycan-N-acetylglucosamine deacetylase
MSGSSTSRKNPVFYDPGGKRRRRVRHTYLTLAILATTLVAILVVSVLVNPLLPRFELKAVASLPQPIDAQPRLPTPPPIPVGPRGQKARRAKLELEKALANTTVVPSRQPSQIRITPPRGRPVDPSRTAAKPLSIGFYVNWDDSSYQSLKINLGGLDWVVPEWIRLQDGPDPLVVDLNPPALDLIRRTRPQLPIIPLVQNYKDELWNSGILARAVADDASRKRLITALSQVVDRERFGGVCIDFEEVPAGSQANVMRFMHELHAAFHARGWLVTQAVPFDNPDWNYKAYVATTDFLMLMAYDEHWSTSEPGPVASQDWFERILDKRMAELEPERTIVCIGSYGYDWTPGSEATEMTFQEAVLAASDSEARISFDQASRNPYFAYIEDNKEKHTVWFLDAVTAYNQMILAKKYYPAGFALWRLGSEDPSIWSVFGSSRSEASVEDMRRIRYGYDVDLEGMGEVLQVVAKPREGAREIEVDESTGLVTSQSYMTIPSSYVIRRTAYHPGLIALTFDDGPDREWTPRILDLLKQEQVPATFFIIGANGQANPQLVRRILAEGHDLGNHTFTHPNLGEMPLLITNLELTATQRLIEAVTGRSTKLFRPPYFGDAEPTTPDEVEPVVLAQDLGYLTVGLRNDPDDWALPGADEIVKRTIESATNPDPDSRGQVVLLHDGGGDRSQTLAALPRLITDLRAKGFKFVTISDLAGLSKDQAMPPVARGGGAWDSLFVRADAITFYSLSLIGWALRWIFLVGIVLGLARMVLIGALALAQWMRARRREAAYAAGVTRIDEPLVSVIVPAYNEERVITKTVGSLLASTYRHLEIVVVDDGSPDRTAEVVRERFPDEPRLRIFRKENGGKAEALNYGLLRSSGEIIVALDADTIFPQQTIAALSRRFSDPRIGAVAGNAKVGNRINLVTRWQALEYITSQNLDRRAFASLNCITVVPGAVGAWRRDLLELAGGFTSDTLAEDQDLTLRIRRLGHLIGYEENAVAWTEAPDTLGTLAKQRFRWAYGTLQCLWKHRDALFQWRYGALGWIALPNNWIFQIIFPLLSPIMDLTLVWAALSAVLDRLQHPNEHSFGNLKQVLFYYALFLAVDWLAAAFAFALEKGERWKLLWWLFLQRFCYRQVMYYVMIRSVATAAHGAVVGWGKLERKATVELQQ